MNRQTGWDGFIAFIFIIIIAGVVWAQDKKDTAEKTAATDCIACHESGDSSHRRSYEGWQASAHSKSLDQVKKNASASPDCYSCHSEEGFKAKLQGKKVDVAQKESFSPVTCTTCHSSHESKNPHNLVTEDSESLCTSCHSQRAVLQGRGAKGFEEARSYHSAVDCVSCHMTEANHQMKVLRPDDPGVSDKRMDTCTGCHKDNNRKARAEQIQTWQESFKAEMDPLQEDVKLVTAALKENPDRLSPELKTKWNDARFNLSMLVRDGSRGAHNHDFASAIMASAAKDLGSIKAAVAQK